MRNILARARGALRSDPDRRTELKRVKVDGRRLRFVDHPGSESVDVVLRDLEHHYAIQRVELRPGDVVLDVGAHVGVVSTVIAVRCPEAIVYSYEPMPENYRCLVRNLEMNGVSNVIPHNLAVTADGRQFKMMAHLPSNSGGATGQVRDLELPEHINRVVESTTLDGIFETNGIERCRLLKMDCEGSEHEILLNARCLDRVDYMSVEIHTNEYLRGQGYTIERLVEHLSGIFPPERLSYYELAMAE